MKKNVFKISFFCQNQVYEIFAKQVDFSKLIGFIEVKELLLNSKSNLVLDPNEERIKNEFQGVESTFIPTHLVLRIDEVAKEGIAKVKELNMKYSNITQFPNNAFLPSSDKT